MPQIAPFPGWRYHPERVELDSVLGPTETEALAPSEVKQYYARHEANAIRLAPGMEYAGDSPMENRFTRAAAHMASWRRGGLLYRDVSAVYLVEQETAAGARRGLLCRMLLEEDESPFRIAGDSGEGKGAPSPGLERLRAFHSAAAPLTVLAQHMNSPAGHFANLVDWPAAAEAAGAPGGALRYWVVDHEEVYGPVCAALEAAELFSCGETAGYAAALAYRDERREAMRAAGNSPPPHGELASDWTAVFFLPLDDPGLAFGDPPQTADKAGVGIESLREGKSPPPVSPGLPAGVVFHIV